MPKSSQYERFDVLIRPETKKLLALTKAHMMAKNYDQVLYWLARIYIEACTKGKICEPDRLYKKLMGCLKNEAIILR